MKTRFLAFLVIAAVIFQVCGQDSLNQRTAYQVASRSAHQTVWERVEWQTNRSGIVRAKTNSFVELATGLNFFDAAVQQWRPSRAEWLVYADAIVAQSGRHKVILATNLNLGGAVEVLTADGVRLLSNPIGLGLYDPVDGKHVMLAQVKDCQAYWGATTNEIVFRDCFDGTRGSIRYLYTLAGLQQHVVLEQRVSLPAGFSDKTRLECYTEFASSTELPQAKSRVLRREKNPTLRTQMVEPDFTDNELAWGAEMKMRAGTAFTLGEESPDRSVRVGKQVQIIGGRPVLIEAVEFKAVESMLSKLTASVEKTKSSSLAVNSSRQLPRALQQARLQRGSFQSAPREKEIQLASSPLRNPAMVIDYELLGSESDFTFKGDTTYFVTNSVYLDGTTTIEGGTVIKSSGGEIILGDWNGSVMCKTAPYLPAIFTSKNDDSVGQTIPGSSGTPGSMDVSVALAIDFEYPNLVLHDLRVSFAVTGFDLVGYDDTAGTYDFRDIQVTHCGTAFRLKGIAYFGNVLIDEVETVFNFAAEDTQVVAEHMTVDNSAALYTGPTGSGFDFTMRNCILRCVDTSGASIGPLNTVVTCSPGVFQTVGAGAHYLINNSTNRDSGTTNINADLLASLKQKTTYPPQVYSNLTISTNLTLAIQVARDGDAPDRGFHYDPVDFIVDVLAITNATITLSNGVTLGYYNNSAGVWLQDDSGLVSIGSPLSPNRFVHYALVQEQPVSIGNVPFTSTLAVNPYHYGATGPTASMRFTKFYAPADGYGLYHGSDGFDYSSLVLRDCEIWNGGNVFDGDSGSSLTAQNTLFHRASFGASSANGSALTFSNNLAWGTTAFFFNLSSSNTWRFFNNAFHDCLVASIINPVDNGYNAYINCDGRLSPTNANDLVLSSFNYASGPLGDFYQSSTNLIDAGSVTNAGLAGLYHHTTTVDEVKDGNSLVDIGLHYIALGAINLPVDTDFDGLPDYMEDETGDGTYDVGDLCDWLISDTDGDELPDGWEVHQNTNPKVATAAVIFVGEPKSTSNIP